MLNILIWIFFLQLKVMQDRVKLRKYYYEYLTIKQLILKKIYYAKNHAKQCIKINVIDKTK